MSSFPIYLFGGFLRVCSTWCLTSSNVLGLFSGGAGGFGRSVVRRPVEGCVGPRLFSILPFTIKRTMAYTDAGTEIRRLFIDSGPKWRVSGRNSLWTYEVPGTSLACKKGTEFCVDHVIVAHGWQPINSSNRNLRIRIRTAVGSPVQSSDFLVQLDE